MATILKRPGKCGSMSFLIRVSLGYDSQNRQIIKSKTFKTDKSLTEKQALKAANKEAILFEEECKAFGLNNRRVKFQILADEWLELVERTQEVKPATIVRFKTLKKRTYLCVKTVPKP